MPYLNFSTKHTNKARIFLDIIWEDRIYRKPCMNQAALCKLLDLEPIPLAMMCRCNFDMTFLQIFKHCKVADVKQILSDPENEDLKISEVAKRAGYEKRPIFNIHFKEVTGMSPTEFRYFHKHFEKTTGMSVAEYNQEEQGVYLPDNQKATFLSNFLNKCVKKII